MVMPLIPIVAGILGGTALGGYLSNSGSSEVGAGFLEIGTSKKLIKTQDTYQYTNNISETITNTLNFQPVQNISPNYSFNPMTAIGSGSFSFEKKEAYSQALNPSWDLPLSVATTTESKQSAEQSMGGSDNLMQNIKQFALLGAVGFIVYKVVTKK